MTEIVLNEKQWVEDILESSSLGAKPSETLGRLARYYHEIGYRKSEVSRMLEEFLLRCDPNTNIVRWQAVIDNSVKFAWKGSLINVEPISITRNELEAIKRLPGILLQRLMFTLVCLAKYGNAVSQKNNSWVNRDIRDVLSLANIKVTVRRQSLLYNDLWRLGYVGYSNIVDNINVNVKILDDSGDSVMKIGDFRNLGNQYMRHIEDGYIACQHCGLIIKRCSPTQKYCKNCSVDINIQKTIENRRRCVA